MYFIHYSYYKSIGYVWKGIKTKFYRAPGLEIPGSATDIDNNSMSRICDFKWMWADSYVDAHYMQGSIYIILSQCARTYKFSTKFRTSCRKLQSFTWGNLQLLTMLHCLGTLRFIPFYILATFVLLNDMMEPTIFSSPELKAQTSFGERNSSLIKWRAMHFSKGR